MVGNTNQSLLVLVEECGEALHEVHFHILLLVDVHLEQLLVQLLLEAPQLEQLLDYLADLEGTGLDKSLGLRVGHVEVQGAVGLDVAALSPEHHRLEGPELFLEELAQLPDLPVVVIGLVLPCRQQVLAVQDRMDGHDQNVGVDAALVGLVQVTNSEVLLQYKADVPYSRALLVDLP